MTERPQWLLAIETSHDRGSIAIGRLDATDGSEPPTVLEFSAGLVHGRELLPKIDEGLRRRGIARGDLAALAVSGGPGSYTGVRVGVSAAKAIAWALSIPGIKISSLEAIASAAVTDGGASRVVTIVDARRGSAYYAEFEVDGRALTRVVDDAIRPVATLFDGLDPNTRLAGSGCRLFPGAEPFEKSDPATDHPSAAVIFELAQRRLAQTNWNETRAAGDLPPGANDPHTLNPTYLRPSEAEEKRTRSKERP